MTKLVIRLFPSIMMIALEIAPHVRRGFLTNDEGQRLVDLRYFERLMELCTDSEWP